MDENINEDEDTMKSSSNEFMIVEEEILEPYTRMELGYWVAQQRYYYNHPIYNETRMTVQRIRFLNKLNFIWNIADAKWDAQYQLLCDFYDKYGHTAVQQSTSLGRWVYKQRYHRLQIERNQTIDKANIPPSAFLHQKNKNETETESLHVPLEDVVIGKLDSRQLTLLKETNFSSPSVI